ncbi:hypothetical protein TNCT_337891 [Trichonephila clavata]|uniref:Uncharacterized protein n=1 Tax=Trichonephila clavata TaxID=2740835 RepID=A0A8X6FPJ8_TRICU|nr:hypothetical protein TNCT_337891 [Trichonephila clavata]
MELSAAVDALFGQELGDPRFQSRPPPPDHDLPRAVRAAAFKIRTGHDYLAARLHRINVLPSPECQLLSYGTMNAEQLKTCSALDHSKNYQNSIFKEAHLYWSARHLTAKGGRWLRR